MGIEAEDPLGIASESRTPFTRTEVATPRRSLLVSLWGAGHMIMGVFLAILSTVYMVGWLQWIARGRPGVIAEIGPLAAIGVLATGWSLLLICGGYGILFRQNWGRLLILGNCVFIGLQGLGIVWGSPLPQLAIFHLLYCGATAAVLLLPMHAAEFSPSTNEGLSL